MTKTRSSQELQPHKPRNGFTFPSVHPTNPLQIRAYTLQYPTEVKALKNQRVTIMMSQEYRTAIEEKAKTAGLNISAYVRHCLDQHHKTPDQPPTNSGIYPTNTPPSELEHRNQQINIKDEQIEAKDQQIEKLQQALDQQQQLHAVSQNTVEAQRLQLEEAKRPQPLLARLKAVFAPE